MQGIIGKLSVIGLGKLGIPMLAAFASKGFEVIGSDLNADVVRLINEEKSPVVEPSCSELLKENKSRIYATTDVYECVQKSEVTFIIVPTPSDDSGAFTNEFVLDAITKVGEALRNKNSYHLVVVTSTVMPGSSGNVIMPALENAAGSKCGAQLGYCYSPEFIALGSVVRDILNPDMVLIGQSDEKAGELLAGIYSQTCNNQPIVARMNCINAELTKLAVNSYVTAKISFANMLSEICEQVPGANVDVITSAMGADTRIGKKYLRGGPAFGGPCFPRDNKAFSVLARSAEVEPSIPQAVDAINSRQAGRIMHQLTQLVEAGSSIAILGLAYKPDTPAVEQSFGIELSRLCAQHGYKVKAFDVCANEAGKQVLGNSVQVTDSLDECLKDAAAIIVALPCPEFQTISVGALTKVIVDCWRMLDKTKLPNHVSYVPVGQHSAHEAQKLSAQFARR